MNLISRPLSSLFVITAILFFLSTLPAYWMLEPGAPADLSGSLMSLLEAQRRDEQLSHQFQSILEREASKDRITQALTNGRMTLIEAAVCYRSLYEDPRSWRDPRRPRPDLNDGVAWCREVIEWAERDSRFEQSPAQADALRQRLDEELQEQLECYGAVPLPD